ncbi:hypothetical protein BH23GEM6_BH23GEM6_02720 [soil metagenome]
MDARTTKENAMRGSLAVVALLTALASCALPQGSGSGSASDYQPLRAFISGPDMGGLGFHVNRPAHVALFEIVPGAGASLVFPSPGMGPTSGFVMSGRANLQVQRIASRDLYRAVYAPARHSVPRFYFLIASERPLNLNSFGTYGMGIQRALGMHVASHNAYSVMERLAEVALPEPGEDGSWTTDVYVDWPRAISPVPIERHVLVTCNGYTFYVRLEYLEQVQQSLCAKPSETPAAQPGDSARAPDVEVIPQRRPPPVTSTALGQRVRTSSQLAEGGELRERRTPDSWRRHAPEASTPSLHDETRSARITSPRSAGGTEGSGERSPGAATGSSTEATERRRPTPEREAAPTRTDTQQRPPERRDPVRVAPAPAPSPAPAPARAPERCVEC